MKQLLISTCHIMVWVVAALWLVGCVSYAELPGGKTYGVPIAAEDRSPFGTNTVFPALLECTERVKHWYKSDEFPRENCTYMADSRMGELRITRKNIPQAEPSSVPSLPTVVTPVPVKHAIVRSFIKHAPKATPVVLTPVVAAQDVERGYYVYADPSPREYFSFASSQGGGYQALGYAALAGGIAGAGALMPANTVSQNTSEFFSTKCTAPCFK